MVKKLRQTQTFRPNAAFKHAFARRVGLRVRDEHSQRIDF
jgi:hypothetical protein